MSVSKETLVKTRLPAGSSAVFGFGLHLGILLARSGMRLLRWLELSQQRRQLASLDDRMLKDIGISRADAENESRRWFWDDVKF